MRLLTLSVLGFALVSFGAMADCPGHGVAQNPSTTVATVDGASPQSTKIEVPTPKTGG